MCHPFRAPVILPFRPSCSGNQFGRETPIGFHFNPSASQRIEFPETLRSVFLSRSNVAVEKEDTSLFVRALAPEIEDTLFVVGEGATSCLKRAAMTF